MCKLNIEQCSEPTNSQDQSQEIHNLTAKAKKKRFAFKQKMEN